jgi:hypothetical protein
MVPFPPPCLVLGHQGGWDEILMVAGPLGVVAWLLWVADRRARRLDGPETGTDPDQASSDDE